MVCCNDYQWLIIVAYTQQVICYCNISINNGLDAFVMVVVALLHGIFVGFFRGQCTIAWSLPIGIKTVECISNQWNILSYEKI